MTTMSKEYAKLYARDWRKKNHVKFRTYQKTPEYKNYQREWYKKNKAKADARTKEWNIRNKKRAADLARRSHLKIRYGLTHEQYEAMFAAQDGLCFICASPPTKWVGLCIDHCHASGKLRKLLCANCNTVLGHVGDNVERLQKLIEYLETHK